MSLDGENQVRREHTWGEPQIVASLITTTDFPGMPVLRGHTPAEVFTVHTSATKPPKIGGPRQWMMNCCPARGETTTDCRTGNSLGS